MSWAYSKCCAGLKETHYIHIADQYWTQTHVLHSVYIAVQYCTSWAYNVKLCGTQALVLRIYYSTVQYTCSIHTCWAYFFFSFLNFAWMTFGALLFIVIWLEVHFLFIWHNVFELFEKASVCKRFLQKYTENLSAVGSPSSLRWRESQRGRDTGTELQRYRHTKLQS